MTRKLAIAAIAALTVAATAAPASAQVGFSVGYNDGWGWSGYNDSWGWGGRSRGYGPGVSVGFGTGYDDWGYDGSYAAAPGYGCSCAGRRYSTYAPRYRSYARTGYPASNYYADYGYNDGYYDRSYASVGFGWSDGGWRDDGWRDRSWRGDRRGSVDRVRTNARVNFDDDREFRGGTRVRSRTSGDIGASVRNDGETVSGRVGANGNGRSGTAVRARVNTESGR